MNFFKVVTISRCCHLPKKWPSFQNYCWLMGRRFLSDNTTSDCTTRKETKSIAHWTLLVEGNERTSMIRMWICWFVAYHSHTYLIQSLRLFIYFIIEAKQDVGGNSWVLGLTLTLHVVGPCALKFNVILHILILVCRITHWKTELYCRCVFMVLGYCIF